MLELLLPKFGKVSAELAPPIELSVMSNLDFGNNFLQPSNLLINPAASLASLSVQFVAFSRLLGWPILRCGDRHGEKWEQAVLGVHIGWLSVKLTLCKENLWIVPCRTVVVLRILYLNFRSTLLTSWPSLVFSDPAIFSCIIDRRRSIHTFLSAFSLPFHALSGSGEIVFVLTSEASKLAFTLKGTLIRLLGLESLRSG